MALSSLNRLRGSHSSETEIQTLHLATKSCKIGSSPSPQPHLIVTYVFICLFICLQVSLSLECKHSEGRAMSSLFTVIFTYDHAWHVYIFNYNLLNNLIWPCVNIDFHINFSVTCFMWHSHANQRAWTSGWSQVLPAPNSFCASTLPEPNIDWFVARKHIFFYVRLKEALSVLIFYVTKWKGGAWSLDIYNVWAISRWSCSTAHCNHEFWEVEIHSKQHVKNLIPLHYNIREFLCFISIEKGHWE